MAPPDEAAMYALAQRVAAAEAHIVDIRNSMLDMREATRQQTVKMDELIKAAREATGGFKVLVWFASILSGLAGIIAERFFLSK